MRVAVGVGSRGIKCLVPVVCALVRELQRLGAQPFIVPAMGSHGGATAAGQIALLAAYGITESATGVPVLASMDTVQIGTVLDDVPVYVDAMAFTQADALIPVARIKPHTDFRGDVESGLFKMLVIGFGKHRGATNLHSFHPDRFGTVIPAMAARVLDTGKVPFGVAIVEDAYEDPGIIEVVAGERFAEREPELLGVAKRWLPRLPFSEADVLLVGQLGKNISGSGMDPNVTGRFPLASMPSDVQIGRLVVLDLTEETEGNATGIGLADVVTRRAADKIDFFKTYVNHVTARLLEGAKLPLVAATDLDAVTVAIATLWRTPSDRVRLAWIKNTLELSEVYLTEPLWQQIEGGDKVVAASGPSPLRFDANGSLLLDG